MYSWCSDPNHSNESYRIRNRAGMRVIIMLWNAKTGTLAKLQDWSIYLFSRSWRVTPLMTSQK